MNRDEIRKILPHREPMLLLDTAERISDTEARGTYHVRGDEFFLQGHFPGHPIVPGVIQCEITAQSACVLFEDVLRDRTKNVLPLYAGMDKVRFRHPVYPGDEMVLDTRITRSIRNIYKIHGKVTVKDTLCMEGDFTVALAEVNDEKTTADTSVKNDEGKAAGDVS